MELFYMSGRLSFNTSAHNAYHQTHQQMRADLLISIKGKTSSESSAVLRANGRNLCFLIEHLYTQFRQNREMLSMFCKSRNIDFSAEVKQSSVDTHLKEVHEAANKALNAVLGLDHGI